MKILAFIIGGFSLILGSVKRDYIVPYHMRVLECGLALFLALKPQICHSQIILRAQLHGKLLMETWLMQPRKGHS